MSTGNATNQVHPVWTPEDARQLAQLAAQFGHEPVGDGWLLEIGKTADGRNRYVVTGGSPSSQIACVREQENGSWLLIIYGIGSPHAAPRLDNEADALEWLTYIADLHTR